MNNNEKKNKTLLSKQLILIIGLGVAALVFAILYFFVFPNNQNLFASKEKTERVDVPLVSEYGDELEVYVIDKQTGNNVLGDLKQMLAGEKENIYNVQKGDGEKTLLSFQSDNLQVRTYPLIFPEIQKSDVSSITITNIYDTFTIGYVDTSEYILGAEQNIYNKNYISTLSVNCLYMLADGYVENPGPLSDYGLDEKNKQATVEILKTDGTKTTVILGDMLYDGRYYMKHADKDQIYIMDSGAGTLLASTENLLSPVVVKQLSNPECYYLDTFNLSKNGEPFFSCRILSEQEKVGAYINQRHVMTYPEQKYVLDTDSVYEMFEYAATLSGQMVVLHNVSKNEAKDEIFEGFGLNTPSFEVSYSYGGSTSSFTVGAMTEDGYYYYVYSPYQDTIVVVPVETIAVFDRQLIDLYEENIFQYNIDNISSIEFKYGDTVCNYVLEGSGKELSIKEANSSKSIDVMSFRRMYMSVLGISMGGYSNFAGSTDNLSHMLTVSATLKTGEKLIYEFYSTSAVSCYMKLDGKGGFETDRRTIEKIIENSEKLMSGITIEADY